MALKRQDLKGNGLNYYTSAKCPVCGKKFDHTIEWAYWRGYVQRKKYFCSWGCMRAYDQKQPRQHLRGEYPSDWLDTRCKVR